VTLTRFRWAIWGVALLIGIGAGIGVLLVHSSSPKASTTMISGPASAWQTGTRKAPAFDLTDQNGKQVSVTAFRGRPLVITFLDPLCRNYCPIEAARLQSVVQSLPAASRPTIVAVSVNVFGNAHRYLVQDIHKWGMGSEFHWGIAKPATLSAVWHRYDIGVLDQKKTIAGIVVHNIVHTEAAYVVDANGYERALFVWPFTAADVKATLTRLSS
jgi:cytochrome oxidase Cu insertion factor (SCO1/SenC/PrrC family)